MEKRFGAENLAAAGFYYEDRGELTDARGES
jgi:hypothetical protein